MQEQRLHKTSLDAEQRRMTDDKYHEEHRNANESPDSLGRNLWIRLRKQEEKEGLVKKFGPDSRGVFVPTLLALYKDPHQSHKRSNHIQSQLKRTSVTVYEAGKERQSPSISVSLLSLYSNASL